MLQEQPNDLTWTVDGFKYLLGIRMDFEIGEIVVAGAFDAPSQGWKGFIYKNATETSINFFGGMDKFWGYIVKTINAELDTRHGQPEDEPVNWMGKLQAFLDDHIKVENDRLKVD